MKNIATAHNYSDRAYLLESKYEGFEPDLPQGYLGVFDPTEYDLKAGDIVALYLVNEMGPIFVRMLTAKPKCYSIGVRCAAYSGHIFVQLRSAHTKRLEIRRFDLNSVRHAHKMVACMSKEDALSVTEVVA